MQQAGSIFKYIGLMGVLLTGTLVASCGESPHDVSVKKEVVSPDGKKVASFYIVSGGGAAGFVWATVKLRLKQEPLKDDDDYIFDMAHAYDIDLKWKSNQQLVVTYPGEAEVYRKKPRDKGVTIAYVAKEQKRKPVLK